MPGLLAAAAACASLFLALPTPARAQSSPLPIRLKLGIMSPGDNDVRNHVGNPLFAGEVEVGLPGATSGQTYAGIGYWERSGHGNSFRVIPVTITRLFSPPNPAAGATGNVYFGFGGGVYFLHRGGDDSGDQTTIGGFGVAGYQFPKTILFFDLIEAKIHLALGSVKGMSPNGLTFMVGRKL